MKDLQRLREVQAEAANRLRELVRELVDLATEQEATREDRAFVLGLRVGYHLKALETEQKGGRKCSG